MNFPEAITSGFKNYATFSGRAARSEYWYWALFCTIAAICFNIIDIEVLGVDIRDPHAFHPFSNIFSLIVLLPNIALAVRRLHDINRSGWWFLIVFIPLIGVIFMIVWACTKGTAGENRFGADPLPA